MAKSNIKSLVIKLNKSYIETISDSNFRLLYTAIKEVVDYWDNLVISQEERDNYKKQYGLTDFIEIEGHISLRNVYLEELQYVCLHVNGNKNDTLTNLIIEPGFNYYILLADPKFHENFLETIGYDKTILDGVTLGDVEQLIWRWNTWGVSTNNNPLAGNYASTWLAYTDSSGSEANRKNCVMNLSDRFVFTNQHNVADIKVYDFTPYYHMIGEYQINAPSTNFGYNWRNNGSCLKATPLPKLLTNIPPLAADSRKGSIDEIWIYVPHQYSYGFSSLHFVLGTFTCSVFENVYSNQDIQTATYAAWGDVNGGKCMVVDRLFVKSWGMGQDRWGGDWYKDKVISVNHLCVDMGIPSVRQFEDITNIREFNDGWARCPMKLANNMIIFIFSTRIVPPSFDSDQEAQAFYSDPSKIRFLTYTGKMTDDHQYESVDGNLILNMYAYVPNSTKYETSAPSGQNGKVYVQDEFYYALKYMHLVKKEDGETAYGHNYINPSCLHSWSEYKITYPSTKYFNPATNKFWWQTNTTMNTIISTYYKNDDPNGYYKN